MPAYKTPQINFICTKEQYKTIEEKASKLGMKLAEYCRFVALNAEITVDIIEKPKEKEYLMNNVTGEFIVRDKEEGK